MGLTRAHQGDEAGLRPPKGWSLVGTSHSCTLCLWQLRWGSKRSASFLPNCHTHTLGTRPSPSSQVFHWTLLPHAKLHTWAVGEGASPVSIQPTHTGGISDQGHLAGATVTHNCSYSIAVPGHLGMGWGARMATGYHCGEEQICQQLCTGIDCHHHRKHARLSVAAGREEEKPWVSTEVCFLLAHLPGISRQCLPNLPYIFHICEMKSNTVVLWIEWDNRWETAQHVAGMQ